MRKETENEIEEIQSEVNEETKFHQKETVSLVVDFDPERRKLAIAYTRTSRRYGFRLTIASFIISIGILISRITVNFKEFLDQNVSTNPLIQIAIFFIVGSLLISLWELPLSFYLHSRLSRKYGLSKLTNRQWFLRHLKGELISLGIGFFLIQGFYWILRTSPDIWWLWAVIALIGFTLIFSALIPIVLLPIFFKFNPLEESNPELAAELVEMTKDVGLKNTNAYNWKLGEIATTGNAGLVGFGKTRRVIIADTMIEQYTTDEIKWILAHEIGHFKRHDLWKGLIIGGLATFITFFLTHMIFTPVAAFFGYPQVIGDISSLPVLGLCFWIFSFILNVPSLWYSRRQEQNTDEFASSVVTDPTVAKSLFIKMADQNLSDIDPPWWERLFFMSHPSIQERIENTTVQS
ncbi:MAG: M48 family metallopeptidase [Candidatus Hodarchaeota archaeon]